MAQGPRLILTLLLILFATLPARGQDPSPVAAIVQPQNTLEQTAVGAEPPSVQSLAVSFSNGLLSVRAQDVPLKVLAEAIARQTGLTITLSPVFASVAVTVQLSHIDLETGLREILRVAGVDSSAWIYRKGEPSSGEEEWALARLALVAKGNGTLLNAPAAPARKTTQHIPDSGKRARARERYFDPQSNRFIDVAAREVLVRFDHKLSRDEISQTIARLDSEVISQDDQLGFCHLRIPATETVSEFIRKHRENPHLRALEPNPLVAVEPVESAPSDPLFRAQWALERIGAPQAWAVTPSRPNVTVAVIDSGIDRTHPDLQGKVLRGRNLLQQNDDTQDDHGHGTAIAGIIAATTNNTLGMAGVCGTCQLLPVKVLDDSGEGTYAHVIAGILWTVRNGARVLNLSVGNYAYSRLMDAAVAYAHDAGAVLVAAAGNEATDAPLYPAALPNVISVSATDVADNLWTESNYGSAIDLAALGVSILSLGLAEGYVVATGSSLSAAQVSGVAGLVRAKRPSLSNSDVAQLLYQTADDLGAKEKDKFYGFGRVNAARALSKKPWTS